MSIAWYGVLTMDKGTEAYNRVRLKSGRYFYVFLYNTVYNILYKNRNKIKKRKCNILDRVRKPSYIITPLELGVFFNTKTNINVEIRLQKG